MPAVRVNFLSSGRATSRVVAYVVEDGKVLGRRSFNLPKNDAMAARLLEYDRWRGGARNGALLHMVLSFADGTPVSVDEAFDYFQMILRGTALEEQPIVVAAHEGRPHLHAVISRVDARGRLVPFRVMEVVERERDLALRYGMGVMEPRERPLPASIVNAETWEGHLTFARYLRTLPWPDPTGDPRADQEGVATLLRRVGVGVEATGRGWRLHHLYKGREDHAKASVTVPNALRVALTPLDVPPDNRFGYGALREAGKLILPAIKRGTRYREVVEAQARSAKGLGYWHRRLDPPAPTWTAERHDSKGPAMIAFERTNDPELDLKISNNLDLASDERDLDLIQALRGEFERSDIVKHAIGDRQVTFGVDEVALAVRHAMTNGADRSPAWATDEGQPGPCGAALILRGAPTGQAQEWAVEDGAVFHGPKSIHATTSYPAFAFVANDADPSKRDLYVIGSLPLMGDAGFLNAVRAELTPVELAMIREQQGIARTGLDAREGAGKTIEQIARERDADDIEMEEFLGVEPPLAVRNGESPDGPLADSVQTNGQVRSDEPDSVIAPSARINDDDEPFVIAPATAGDHAGKTAGRNGHAGADPVAANTAQITKLLNAWMIYLDKQGLTPERTTQLISAQRNAIYAYIRLAADLRAHAQGGREGKADLSKSLSLLAETTAVADFTLAAASADLNTPLYSPGEFADADDTKSMREGVSASDIVLGLGRGEYALPMGARAMSVAKALSRMSWTAATKDEPGAWSVPEEGQATPTFFTEKPDGYHFSKDLAKSGANGIRAALLLAANEDDGAVTLTGSRAFRAMVGRQAAMMGIRVTNNRERIGDENHERDERKKVREHVSSLDLVGREKHLQTLLGIDSLGAYQDQATKRDERLTLVEMGPHYKGARSTLAYDTSRRLVCALLPLDADKKVGDVVDVVFGENRKPHIEAVEQEMARDFKHEQGLLDERQGRDTRVPPVRTIDR